MAHPAATTGQIEGNPVRAGIEEGAAMLGVDFVLNVVVDEEQRVVAAVAGDATAAHRRGCQYVAERVMVPLEEPADIVLVSAGGYPKDINLYQAQKALDNAARAVRDGGIIILVAECREGFGNETFEDWMMEGRSPGQVLERLQQEFVLGGHKAAAIAKVLKRAQVSLVSRMQPASLHRCGLVPFNAVDQALEEALAEIGPEARVIVLPEGGSTVPVLP
jgi:nickel-dependent lactate racemase